MSFKSMPGSFIVIMDTVLSLLTHLCLASLSLCFTTFGDAFAQKEFDVGLIWDTVPYSGYLKVFHNGEWGGVCPISANWGWTEQDVVCRQLGYPKVNKLGGTKRSGHAAIQWVLNGAITCNGTEPRLQDCRHGALGEYQCPYRYHPYDSLYVDCSPLQEGQDIPVRLASGPYPNEGRVEIFWNNTWGNIYSSIWAHEYAEVICRQLDYKYTLSAVQEGYYKGSDVPGHTTVVLCTGNEIKLAECQITFWPSTGNYGDYPRGVRCSNYDPPQDLGVRLVHGEGLHEGEVQVFHNGTWGYICNENKFWDNSAARAVCRELGYISESGTYSTRFQNHAGDRLSPENAIYFLNDVKCDGFESRLSDCKHSATGKYQCRYFHYKAKVTCAKPAYPQEVVHLVGGNVLWEGFVQTYMGDESVSGDWSFACKEDRMDIADMHVICRQLGYGFALAPPISHSFTNPTKVLASNRLALSLDCTGLEKRISDCRRDSSPGKGPCLTLQENLAIRCSNNLTRSKVGRKVRIVEGKENPAPGQGYVEVFHKDQWWQICKYGWDIKDANVVCRQLGFQLARSTDLSYVDDINLSEETFILSDIDCTGSEANLQECGNTEPSQSMSSNCKNNYASVSCINSSTKLIDGSIQLIGTTSELKGRIQIYQDKKWWTICDKSWDMSDAFVTCRQLGFASAQEAYRGSEHAWKGPTSDDCGILMDGLYCRGNESNLLECAHSEFGKHTCTHEDDVGVWCSHTQRDIPIPELSLRLVDGNNHREGRVEVAMGNQWGTICAPNMDMKAAHAICRQLGLSYAVTALPSEHFVTEPLEAGPVHLCNLTCAGNEDHIERCSFTRVPVAYPHANDVGVICSDRGAPSEFDVRLTGGSQQNSGQVEIYSQERWGTLCTSTWAQKEADMICHQMGYASSESTDATVVTAKDTLMLVHNLDLNCEKGEAFHKANCWSPAPGCRLSHPLRVTCSKDHAKFPDLRLSGGGKAAQGRVEIFYANQWWGICPDLWHLSDAQVICHQLGNSKATSISTSQSSGHTAGYLLSKVNCSGSEIRLSECDRVYGAHECMVDQYAEAECATDELPVRLNGGRNYATGRIEINYDNAWRGMCADFLNNNTALVICRDLGFDPNGIADMIELHANYSVPETEQNLAYLPFQATCKPETKSLLQCTREYGKQECPSGRYATLKCADIIGTNALHKLGIVLGVVTVALIIIHLMAYFKYRYDQEQEEKNLKTTAAYISHTTQEDPEGGEIGSTRGGETGNTEATTPCDAPQGDTKENTQSTIEMNSISGAVQV